MIEHYAAEGEDPGVSVDALHRIDPAAVIRDFTAAGALALRVTCDACHAAYLRPYVPSTVKQDDVNFDFDSVLKKK